MKLSEWVAKEVERRNIYKTAVLTDLAEISKVSLLTLQKVEQGGRMTQYPKAMAVSKATGNKVTVRELCE